MSHFSNSYISARKKFLTAAARIDASVYSYDLDSTSELAIDVAIVGSENLPSLVLSSGLHGVEGFFGSAVQLSFLENLATNGLNGLRYVFIHALNPYGFQNIRRFDRENIDLNRNFLAPGDAYAGAPDGYEQLNRFLNPPSQPLNFEFYRLKALGYLMRFGMPSLKASIVCGQYDFPQGVFFGGSDTSETARIVEQYCDEWIGESEFVLHMDLHTGLGAFGAYKLLLNQGEQKSVYEWYVETFGENNVEQVKDMDGTAYSTKGSMGAWLQNRFQAKRYRFVVAEFGTYGPIRVLGAIRAENRGHHYGYNSKRQKRAVEQELMECFCPRSQKWRNGVMDSSMEICDSAIVALHNMKK